MVSVSCGANTQMTFAPSSEHRVSVTIRRVDVELRKPSPESGKAASPRWLPWLVAGLAVVLVVMLGFAAGVSRERRDEVPNAIAPSTIEERTETTTAPASLVEPVESTGDERLDAELTVIARFVEQQRGHPFLRPVHVELLDQTTFERRIGMIFDEGVDELRLQGRVLRALGVVPPAQDLVEVARTLAVEGVLGLYDPVSDELMVRGADLTPFTSATVAHELTHALDDQWYELDRPELDADHEASFGFQAIVEGTAQWVENAYRDSLPAEERARIMIEEAAFVSEMDLSGLPPTLVQVVESPYTRGEIMITRLVDLGGKARIDATFEAPPTSSEQVLHPERYENGEPRPVIERPPADGEVIDDGSLGELGIVELLSTAMAPVRARDAADGWSTDRYVAWARPDGTACIRADIAMDDEPERRELVEALESWAIHQPEASVVSTGDVSVRFMACG